MAHRQSVDFKQETVRIALTSGLTRKQVASDLGVGFSTLSKPDITPEMAAFSDNWSACNGKADIG